MRSSMYAPLVLSVLVVAGCREERADTTRTTVVERRVEDANHDPVAVEDRADTLAGTPVVIRVLANDTDDEGDALSVSAVDEPGDGAVRIEPDGSLTYTPEADFDGEDSFTYTLRDATGRTAEAKVTVAVKARVHAEADDVDVEAGESVEIDVLGNDDGAGTLRVAGFAAPPQGTVEVLEGGSKLRYTAPAGWTGTTEFSYTAQSEKGGAGTAKVTVRVKPRSE